MIIVSNTSPINYLILIGHINLLPELFRQMILLQFAGVSKTFLARIEGNRYAILRNYD
jgi:predicted nucleic acid-binding protein